MSRAGRSICCRCRLLGCRGAIELKLVRSGLKKKKKKKSTERTAKGNGKQVETIPVN